MYVLLIYQDWAKVSDGKLYGEMSDVLDRAFELAEALPRSDLRIIEDCSHSLLMEAPDVVADHLAPWLADPARAAAASSDGRSS